MNAEANTPQEWRKSFKLIVAAVLALSLWGFLGRIAYAHFESSRDFSNQIAATDSSKIDQIEKAALHLDGTFKTLYALITPLATAVTGYFFVASGSPSVSLQEANEEGTPNDTTDGGSDVDVPAAS